MNEFTMKYNFSKSEAFAWNKKENNILLFGVNLGKKFSSFVVVKY